MSLNLVTGPDVEPLTAAEAKARLNIGDEISDDVMDALISASRNMIDGRDGWLGRALNTQTWDLMIDRFDAWWNTPVEKGFYPYADWAIAESRTLRGHRHGIAIPLPPLQSVTSIKYLDTDGVQQTLDPATYIVHDGVPAHIVLATGAAWPSTSLLPGSVVVRFIAGYGDKGSDVPEDIRMYITLQVSHFRSLTQQNLFLSRETLPGVMDRGWTMGGGAETALNGAMQSLLASYRVWM